MCCLLYVWFLKCDCHVNCTFYVDKTSNQTLWDYCKVLIKEKSILYATIKSKEIKNTLFKLENKLKTLIELSNNEQANEKINLEIISIEKEIENIYTFKATGAQIRSRIEIIENDEKQSKLFLGLEKSRQSRKLMHTLNVNGKKITDIKEIINHEVQFYKDLYSSDNTDDTSIHSYLNDTVFEKTLNEDDAKSCDGPLTLEEITKEIFEMKCNKSPGLSVLTIEFYKQFWDKIKYIVSNSINEGYFKGELSPFQKQCVLSLLYKKGDPENLENWRPISLLNTDYKIITRVLAIRLSFTENN